MVTETSEGMNRMVDTVNNGFRAAIDAGQRTQEAFFRASREAMKHPAEVERFFPCGEKMTKQWVGFVGKNMEATAEAVNANFTRGIEMWNIATRTDSRDAYDRTRQIWDAAFEGVRANFDVMTQSATRMMETCSTMFDSARGQDDRKSGQNHQQNNQPAQKSKN